MNCLNDPAPPASHCPAIDAAPAPASAILEASPGAPSTQPRPQKSRRRKAARSANHKAAPRQANPVTPDDLAANDNSAHRRATQPLTPDEHSANHNSARRRATRPRSTANDCPEMKSNPVEHPCSFHSSRLSQPPISAANQNSGSPSCQDHSEFWGLYKPAQTDPSQDLTATHSRVNISGFGLSSPALQQPSAKSFSGLPSRRFMTSPQREAGEAEREPWDRVPAAALRRSPRHAAASGSHPARSCRL